MQNSRLGILLCGRHGTEIPQRDETRTVELAGGHTRTARLDRGLYANARSCDAEGVASTRVARADVTVCSNMLIVCSA
jgi:hypothetical protein